ncbi:MAG: serine/threonine protein kinase, partial [Myxococcota bacterium]
MQPPSLPPRYLPLRRLGEGATGHVWEALDSQLNLPVAVKVVRQNLAKYARFRARFAREVALSARLVHPRMVPVYDYGRLENGCPYVVMGLADQGCLGQLLRWGPPLSEVLRMVDQVLEALAALHARGLVHQDLKPENVLLHNGPLGEVDAWVADLGVAGTFSELAMVKRGVAGTPEWMAPEQLSRRPQELGPWTDLYALGRMLHDILGGEPTPSHLGPKQLLAMRLRPPEPPPNVPDAIGQIIVRLLDPDPRQRYDRAADVRRALRDAAMRIEDGQIAHGSVSPGSTTFPVTMLVEAQESIAMPRSDTTPSDRVPRWNRVAPDPMPATFPAPYRELPPRASLALFAMRPVPLVGREDLQQFLWQKAREVIERQGPRVVLIVGPSGSGKMQLADSVAVALEEGGYMETIRLRYHQPSGLQDGYQGAVREILAPWHDTREQMVARLQRWLGRDRQIAPELAAREAEVLTRWCGYSHPEETTINAAVGLAFLYRHLDARSWRGGSALLLENAHLARAAGDGLAICEALLDHSVGQRPVLAMVTLSSEALENDPALASKVAALEARGAMRINAARLTLSELRQMMTQGLWMDSNLASILAPLCEGSPSNAALLLRDLTARACLRQGQGLRTSLKPEADPREALPASLGQLFERRVEGALAQAADPEAASEALAAAALAGQDPPVSLIRGINAEGLDSLFASGILRQRGWLVRFEHPGVARAARKRALARPDLAALHRRLASGWESLGESTGGDVDTYKGSHWLYAGDAAKALTPLLRATRTAIEEGRAAVGLDAARLAITAAD